MAIVNAVHVDDRDSCVVVVEEVKQSQVISYYNGNKEEESVIAHQDIPVYHKAAIREIRQGEPVIKYGEPIGYATQDIHVGDHVHIHNVRPVGALRK